MERYTQTLAAALARNGDAVSVVARRPLAFPPEPELRREKHEDKLAVYRLAGGQVKLDSFLAHHQRLEELFTVALVEAAPDVIQVNHLLGLPPRLIAIAHRLRVPVVLMLHDHYFACPLINLRKRSSELCSGPNGGRECARTCFAHEPAAQCRWKLRWTFFSQLLGAVERVICPSPRVAAYFEQLVPKAAPIHVEPLGISVGSHAAGPVDARRAGTALRLAYFGSVAPHKGVHMIVDALRLARSGASLTVLGRIQDRDYARSLEEAAAAVPTLTLHIHGEYEQEEMPALLRNVDVVVVPSQVPEVFPLVPREALAYGIPVLVGRFGGLPEAVVEGENGFTFDATRPDELAAILRRLGEDTHALANLRRGAAQTPVLTIPVHVRAMRRVYEDVIDENLRSKSELGAELARLDFLHAQMVQVGLADPY